jgi:hypothetical protein
MVTRTGGLDMNHRHRLIVAAVVLAAATLPGFSQVLNNPILYRLERTSTFARGCFPPCMCPVLETNPIAGTFRLSLVTVGDVFDFYEVTGVRWKLQRSNGEVVEVTGSGTYAVSTIIDQQRMELTLVVGNESPTVYRSGDVPGGAAFPGIALPISINGGFCHDTEIDVRAKPARRLYVEPAQLRWDRDPENTSATSDVVFGDLRTLRATAGAFDVATWACASDGNASSSASFSEEPSRGEGFWFLERATGDLYEDGDAAEIGSPDPEIALSHGACP